MRGCRRGNKTRKKRRCGLCREPRRAGPFENTKGVNKTAGASIILDSSALGALASPHLSRCFRGVDRRKDDSMTRQRKRRPGLTRFDVLVGLALFGFLVGLLLPAV